MQGRPGTGGDRSAGARSCRLSLAGRRSGRAGRGTRTAPAGSARPGRSGWRRRGRRSAHRGTAIRPRSGRNRRSADRRSGAAVPRSHGARPARRTRWRRSSSGRGPPRSDPSAAGPSGGGGRAAGSGPASGPGRATAAVASGAASNGRRASGRTRPRSGDRRGSWAASTGDRFGGRCFMHARMVRVDVKYRQTVRRARRTIRGQRRSADGFEKAQPSWGAAPRRAAPRLTTPRRTSPRRAARAAPLPPARHRFARAARAAPIRLAPRGPIGRRIVSFGRNELQNRLGGRSRPRPRNRRELAGIAGAASGDGCHRLLAFDLGREPVVRLEHERDVAAPARSPGRRRRGPARAASGSARAARRRPR